MALPPPRPSGETNKQFRQIRREVVADLERRVATVGLFLCAFSSVAIFLGHRAGSHVPVKVMWVALGMAFWYAGVWFFTRAGRYRRWMRYISMVIEVSVPSGLMLIDRDRLGPLYALTAAGPALYAVSVTMASLRLDATLCLLTGGFGALQYFLLSQFALAPGLREAGFADLVDPVVLSVRAAFIFSVGVLGYYAAREWRRLLIRLNHNMLERERVRGLFGMHVSEQVMEYLLSGGVSERGERRAVTICFTDIRGFTSLSEMREPEELVRLLNLYFARMCAVVARHGGVVNKFLGDGMLIVFGAPAHLPDDAVRALSAAREMLEESARMRQSGDFPGLRIGIGLHRGEVVVGNVGGDQRQEYTVIGDTVNTASRVQDLTKPLARELLFTRDVLEATGEGGYEALGLHAVKGREAPIELFTLAEPASQAA